MSDFSSATAAISSLKESKQWVYSITDTEYENGHGVIHSVHRQSQPTAVSLYPDDRQFQFYEYDSTPPQTATNWATRRQYQTFQLAFAAVAATIDWGTVPTSRPSTWRYRGYPGRSSPEPTDYRSYLETATNPVHQFTNTLVGYTVTVESVPQATSAETERLTIHTGIKNSPPQDETEDPSDCLLTEELPDDRNGLSRFFTLLENGLSPTIYAQTNHR